MKASRFRIVKSLQNFASTAPRSLQRIKAKVKSRRQSKREIQIGDVISHYKIIEKFGSGGLGIVYKAEDTNLKRTVALKFLPPELTRDEDSKARFIQEAQSASVLEHNNICNIHEIGETKRGHLFIAMSCYDGETLQMKIQEAKLTIEDSLDYAIQLTDGLKKAHQKNIIHGDIKPANVFITDEKVLKIFNFGLAKLARHSKFSSSEDNINAGDYMSPELVTGEEPDQRTDIWSVGAILYRMLSGKLPFENDDTNTRISAILNEEPLQITKLREELSPEFERIVNKSLRKNKADRYQHIEDLNVDLLSLKQDLEKEKLTTSDNHISGDGRKLAAIMFSDMVGYSALTQKNESLAIELLEEHRRILRSLFPEHQGHEIETAGDSFFVEFSSALEAVNCAIEIQKTLNTHNKSQPDERKINIRIGVHLADVVHKGPNVIGDGVNIAARIEPLAQTGGICISQDVVSQIENKIDYPLIRFETANLKNIEKPIDIYTIDLPWLDKKLKPKSTKKFSKTTIWSAIISFFVVVMIVTYTFRDNFTETDPSISKAIPVVQWDNSIAILPFSDLSPEGDQDWFCDGMTEQIISNLANLPRLKVISRTSVMKYKGTTKSISQIGRELNVAHILEGSVQKLGDRIRVVAQLIGTKDDFHLWAETYDREYKELFSLQDDISHSIASNLLSGFKSEDYKDIKIVRPKNTDAYEYLQKGNFYHEKLFTEFDLTDWKTAENMYKKAIDFDPYFADSYARLANLYNSYYMKIARSDAEKSNYMMLQEVFIDSAYHLDSTSANVLVAKGWIHRAKTREFSRTSKYDLISDELNNAFFML